MRWNLDNFCFFFFSVRCDFIRIFLFDSIYIFHSHRAPSAPILHKSIDFFSSVKKTHQLQLVNCPHLHTNFSLETQLEYVLWHGIARLFRIVLNRFRLCARGAAQLRGVFVWVRGLGLFLTLRSLSNVVVLRFGEISIAKSPMTRHSGDSIDSIDPIDSILLGSLPITLLESSSLRGTR